MVDEDVRTMMMDRYRSYIMEKPGASISRADLAEFLSSMEAVFNAAEAEARLEMLEDGTIEVTRNKLIMIAADVVNIVMEKNADYQDSWQKQGIQGTLVRIADKLCRIETLVDGRQALVAEEKLEQTLLDNIGYSFLALLWLKEKSDGIGG